MKNRNDTIITVQQEASAVTTAGFHRPWPIGRLAKVVLNLGTSVVLNLDTTPSMDSVVSSRTIITTLNAVNKPPDMDMIIKLTTKSFIILLNSSENEIIGQ